MSKGKKKEILKNLVAKAKGKKDGKGGPGFPNLGMPSSMPAGATASKGVPFTGSVPGKK